MSQGEKRFTAEATGVVCPRIPDHELLLPIGGGSYGTVWLARNTVGTFRAVKLVERARFEDERPYEREYEGLKLFEPVSRAHEGLVDILHLGRDEEEGYFYYIMEAADDVVSGQQIDPESYTPRTLEHDLKRGGRLPLGDCIQVGAAVANSLAFLHRSHLVHRDLKPSNILFINGAPKIADVGLVARAGAATFVGSEGFVAPEGPGKPQADIYSLGKVIYEMAMGKDRQSFPSTPTGMAEWPDRKEIAELSEIIHHACDPSLKGRYRRAEELAADLILLQHGGRPSRLRRKNEFIGRLKKTAALVVAMLVFVLLGWGLRKASSAAMTENEDWRLNLITKLTLPAVQTWRFAQVGHFDDDGVPDIMVTASNSLHIRSIRGKAHEQPELPPSIGEDLKVELAPNFFQNGQDGVFLTWRNHRTNLNLALLRKGISEAKVFVSTGGLDPRGQNGSSMLTAPHIIDLNQDGSREMIAELATGYGTGPRGVCCFDFYTSKFLWEFLTAPGVPFVQFTHLTNDIGPLDLVIGSNSPNNGKTLEDGSDDGHCYLYAVSAAGQQLWRREVGKEYTTCRPLLVQAGPHKTKEIIVSVFRSCGITNDAGVLLPAIGKLMRFDYEGHCLSQYDLGAALESSVAAELGADDAPEILASDQFGRLHILDARLNPISVTQLVPRQFTNQLDSTRLSLDAVEDLNRDGRKELVFHCCQVKWISGLSPRGFDKRLYLDNSVLVFDNRLRFLAKHIIADRLEQDPGLRIIVTELIRGGRKSLVILGSDARVLELVRK